MLDTTLPEGTPAPAPAAIEEGKPVYVAFDTETTGLFIFKDKATGLPVPADDPRQPRLASVGFILTDAQGRELSRSLHFVKPDGWTMTEEATAVNGLTTEFLAEFGKPVAEVLDLWEGFIRMGLFPAAFNAQHDMKMMRAELRRAGRPDLFEVTQNTCLMRALKAYKDKGLEVKSFGMVSLKAACEFFGIVNLNAHDAMADAEAARAILEILIRDGNLIPPAVHRSKAREDAA